MPRAAIVSFRLGGPDGVAVEAAKWSAGLTSLGVSVTTVAGEGTADVLLPGLAIGAVTPPSVDEVTAVLAPYDVVIVENLLSLPLNPAGSEVVAGVLRGRSAVVRHHDLPWQREQFASFPPPPDDPAWSHVTINELSRRQLAAHGIDAQTVYNSFDTRAAPGDRVGARRALGVGDDERLLLHPTRAIPRKSVPAAVELAARVEGTYWLLGPADDDYGPELDAILDRARARVRVLRGTHGLSVADAYAACDAVVYPSTWEGFGNPSLESAVHRRPLAIGAYPVAAELAAFGFKWFSAADSAALAGWFQRPDPHVVEHNHTVARRHFDSSMLPGQLETLLAPHLAARS